jgi:D-alanine transaminase
MSHVAYVNGRYEPQREAVVSIDDRASQFADAAYEVICIWNGRPVDYAGHLVRLERSLKALQIALPMSRQALTVICREIVRRNHVDRGIVYIQISRGIAPRAHPFPTKAAKASVIVTARSGAGPSDAVAEQGVKVVTAEDIRWGRCDIKSTGLLPNVLARQIAAEAKAFETLLRAKDGTITEASASNAWMVATDGTIVTRPTGNDILAGVTRATVLELAQQAGYPVAQRAFTLHEAREAREVFLTGTTTFVMPVVQIDVTIVANGVPGSIARELRKRYAAHVETQTGSESAWIV